MENAMAFDSSTCLYAKRAKRVSILCKKLIDDVVQMRFDQLMKICIGIDIRHLISPHCHSLIHRLFP